MRYHSKVRFVTALVLTAFLAAACRQVEESSPVFTSVTVITPAAETVTETHAETEMTSETETETELHTETETTTETAEIPETTTVTELPTETVTTTQTETKLTLQAESPPERTETRTETVTEAVTVTEAETPAPPKISYAANSYSALNFKEQKGFWITYLEYASILKNKSESSFRKSIGSYFDNIAGLGFNTVYVQVRAFGDAYYASNLYPSGEQFDGTIGTKNSFDALKVMIDCAHERGMSIHAWVNPMRLMTTSQIEKIDDGYPIKKWYSSSKYNGTYIVKSGDRWYLNPAYDEVTDLISSGITEIVSKYSVDGVQIDDYFYPTTDKAFDSAAYSAYGGGQTLYDWRISNVNKMVKKLYSATHSANSTVVFGISPQGSVENNYNQLYADVRTWCGKSGYCDYILPQVYFGFEGSLPYAEVAAQWNKMVKGSGVKLVIGLAAYKIGAEDKWAGNGRNEWLDNSDVIARQMAAAKELSSYGGVAIYRYDSLFNPERSVAAQVNKELKNIEK